MTGNENIAYDELRDRLRRFVRRQVENDYAVEEICAQTLAELVEAERRKPIVNRNALAYDIARKRIVDWIRAGKKRRLEQIEPNEETLADTQRSAIDEFEDRQLIDVALKTLNARECKISYLHYIKEMSYHVIAGVLGMSEVAVRKGAGRAFVKLRKKFKR